MDKCGYRAGVWGEGDHITGLCALPPGHGGSHLVEVASTDVGKTDYSEGAKQMKEDPPEKRELYEFQREALEKIRNGSVLNGDVGSGKTTTALAYYVEKVCGGVLDRSEPMITPKKLVIITTAKKRDELDWEAEALHYGIFREPELSYSGQEFIVDSWNNMKKYVELEDCFFIFDEQRLVGSGTWVKTFLKIAKQNQWILLSATPADTWIDYVPLFIAHGFYRNRTDFIEQHVVWTFHGRYRKIRGFFGQKKLRKHRDEILVEMPFDRHTKRHLLEELVEHDSKLFDLIWKNRWNVYDDVPIIDVAEMHRLGRKVVNSDESRLNKIEELSHIHPKMIIFYNFDYELELLRTLMTRLDIPVAEWNGHRHEPVPGTERWLYLVQYQAGSEGWNCTSTDCVVFYSLTYSHKQFEQAQGRIDRLDTPYIDLLYYILMSNSKIDQAIWRALQNKKSFHEGRNTKFRPSEPIKMEAA